jgi:hypothetical protein
VWVPARNAERVGFRRVVGGKKDRHSAEHEYTFFMEQTHRFTKWFFIVATLVVLAEGVVGLIVFVVGLVRDDMAMMVRGTGIASIFLMWAAITIVFLPLAVVVDFFRRRDREKNDASAWHCVHCGKPCPTYRENCRYCRRHVGRGEENRLTA